MPRDQRRAQILDAAAVAFSECGFAATSMEDVARAAGITKLIVYRHFESKAELYREILELVAGRLADEWARSAGTGVSAVDVLLTVAREQPEGFRLLFVHAAREADFARYHADFRLLQLDLAERAIGPLVTDGALRQWACRQAVDHLVAAVLNWIEIASASDDDPRFARIATRAVAAMVAEVVGDPDESPPG